MHTADATGNSISRYIRVKPDYSSEYSSYIHYSSFRSSCKIHIELAPFCSIRSIDLADPHIMHVLCMRVLLPETTLNDFDGVRDLGMLLHMYMYKHPTCNIKATRNRPPHRTPDQ